jgi:hypothetical protein
LDNIETRISGGRSRPVDETFRVFDPDQGLLLPPSLDDWLPAEHLARLIAELSTSMWILSAFGPPTPRGAARRAMIRG